MVATILEPLWQAGWNQTCVRDGEAVKKAAGYGSAKGQQQVDIRCHGDTVMRATGLLFIRTGLNLPTHGQLGQRHSSALPTSHLKTQPRRILEESDPAGQSEASKYSSLDFCDPSFPTTLCELTPLCKPSVLGSIPSAGFSCPSGRARGRLRDMEFSPVTAVAKANVYFDGGVVSSHAIIFPMASARRSGSSGKALTTSAPRRGEHEDHDGFVQRAVSTGRRSTRRSRRARSLMIRPTRVHHCGGQGALPIRLLVPEIGRRGIVDVAALPRLKGSARGVCHLPWRPGSGVASGRLPPDCGMRAFPETGGVFCLNPNALAYGKGLRFFETDAAWGGGDFAA